MYVCIYHDNYCLVCTSFSIYGDNGCWPRKEWCNLLADLFIDFLSSCDTLLVNNSNCSTLLWALVSSEQVALLICNLLDILTRLATYMVTLHHSQIANRRTGAKLFLFSCNQSSKISKLANHIKYSCNIVIEESDNLACLKVREWQWWIT